jgi:hemerythrin-like domain-containing protein
MKGPVKAVLFVHNAILRDTSTFQEAVTRIGTEASTDVWPLLDQFRFLRKVLEFHEESEDREVFPLLEGRYSHVTDTYVYDHRRQQALYGEIQAGLEALAGRGSAGRASDVADLQRLAQHFGLAMGLHVAKENELLYPLYDQTYSVEEQVAINMRLQQEHPPAPELIAQLVPWMFRLQAPDDRVGLARFYLGVFPPEGRPALVKMLSGGVTPDEWADVTRRVPDLAA